MKQYYLYYDESAQVNYCFLFALFCIAEKNKSERLNNIIKYSSQTELKNKIYVSCNYKISVSTISRILSDKATYHNYFFITEDNTIVLNNNFKSTNQKRKSKFIVLSEKEIIFLLNQDNKQLNKYYLYLKYYCGLAKAKQIDTTANQILSALGYSIKCGTNKNNLCKYNSLLAENGFINITKYTDEKGHCRNIYKVNL